MLENNQNPTSPQPSQIPPWKSPGQPNNPPQSNPTPYRFPSQNNPVPPRPLQPNQAFRPATPLQPPIKPNQVYQTVPLPPVRPSPNAQQFNQQPQPLPKEEKDWGPIKPIRRVPKPTEKQLGYVLARAERVDMEETTSKSKRRTIIGSTILILVIVGGTAAFIFFGRGEGTSQLTNQPVIVSNTNSLMNNRNLADQVFPSTNSNTNQSNVNKNNSNINSQVNSNTNIDSDNDGLTDVQEIVYGTSPNNPDTDGDGYLDGPEVSGGFDPLKGGGAKLAE
ncbi:MAG: hypothetical protein WCT08_03895 [Patescibacteria group bacterium]|jgi:hypothetical protein